MNIINKGLLKLVLSPTGLYKRLQVDSSHLKAILTTKLIIDDRRPNTFQLSQKRKKEKPISSATIGTMLISLLMGVLYLITLAIGQDAITKLTLYFSFFFFMLASSLISDFTAVLIDVRDNYIILPRPVTDKTVLLARILHIFIHICKVVIPMSLPGLVTVIMVYGVGGGLVFLLMVAMLTLFTIFFINALYILILKITTPQRFQSIISSIQIIFAIVLYASYQILPRMMRTLDGFHLNAGSQPALILLPPYWFASGWSVLYNFKGSVAEVTSALFSIVLPLLSIYIIVKYLAPAFNNKLAMINSGEQGSQKLQVKNGRSSSYSGSFGKIFTRPGPERMGFLFTWKMTSRSRDFRLKVYPGIGYILVYVVVMLVQRKGISMEEMQQQTMMQKTIVLMAVYLSSFLLIMAINQAKFSEKYKAAWLYFTTPVQKPGAIIKGAAKAITFKFLFPLAVLVLTGGWIVFGAAVLPNIFFGLANQLLIVSLVVYGGNRQLPFSLHQDNNSKSGSFFKNLFLFLCSAAIGVMHFFVYSFMPVVIICTVLSAIGTWMLLDSIENISWEKIIRIREE